MVILFTYGPKRKAFDGNGTIKGETTNYANMTYAAVLVVHEWLLYVQLNRIPNKGYLLVEVF